jgi:accessory colonization factor AcfC
LGKIYKPCGLVNSEEGFSRTSIDQLAMRNSEIINKQFNEKRILELGDSFTEGLQVNDVNLYTKVLETSLK